MCAKRPCLDEQNRKQFCCEAAESSKAHAIESTRGIVQKRYHVQKERNGKTLAKNNVLEATQNLTTIVQEASRAIINSAYEARELNLQFTQNTLENGIEVLKSNAEDIRHVIHELEEQAKPQQEVFQTVVNAALAAQERNVKLFQSVLENGTEVLKAHAKSSRDLAQTLTEQSRKQQEALQTVARGSFNTFVDFLTAPFPYLQETLEAAIPAVWQKGESEQHATREGVAAHKGTRQAQTK